MGFKVRLYPHNDLMNLAFYHLQIVNEKEEADDRDGIKLDCMSLLIALAFSVEALINFVGQKKVRGWKERDSYTKKLRDISEAIGLKLVEESEPVRTLDVLKTVRDQMAHGKPIETTAPGKSKDDLRASMALPWDQYLEPEFCRNAFAQVRAFKTSVLNAAGISLAESLTSASGGG